MRIDSVRRFRPPRLLFLVPCCWCLLFCGTLRLSVAGEGKLERLRDEVRSDDDGGSRRKRRGSSGSSGGSDAHEWWSEPLAEMCTPVVLIAVGAPFWFHMRAVGDEWAVKGRFPSHPYYVENDGHMILEGSKGFQEADQWALRLSIEDGYDFDEINRAGFNFHLSTTSRFGLEGNFHLFTEEVDGGGTDNLAIGDINAIVRFAQHERVQFRAGLGFRYLADVGDNTAGDDGFDGGINFLYGADFFPVKPLVVSGTLDLGTLGEAFVFHSKVTFGVILMDWELYAGYDYFRVESVEIHGPMVGLRYWF